MTQERARGRMIDICEAHVRLEVRKEALTTGELAVAIVVSGKC